MIILPDSNVQGLLLDKAFRICRKHNSDLFHWYVFHELCLNVLLCNLWWDPCNRNLVFDQSLHVELGHPKIRFWRSAAHEFFGVAGTTSLVWANLILGDLRSTALTNELLTAIQLHWSVKVRMKCGIAAFADEGLLLRCEEHWENIARWHLVWGFHY